MSWLFLFVSLQIYDGIIDDNALIGKYCNSYLPKTITTSSKRLHVIFFSDGSVIGAGFNASYDHVDGTYHHENMPI